MIFHIHKEGEMQDEFGNSRIEAVFHLIKEIIGCWFEYNIKEENAAQKEEILSRIQNTAGSTIIPIIGELYTIIITLHQEEIKLTIQSNIKGDEISDRKLRLFKVAAERAKSRPENGFLSPITIKLQGNRLIFKIACQAKTSIRR